MISFLQVREIKQKRDGGKSGKIKSEWNTKNYDGSHLL